MPSCNKLELQAATAGTTLVNETARITRDSTAYTVQYVSAEFVRFKDFWNVTYSDIPAERCNITITPTSYASESSVTYTFSSGVNPAYDMETTPPTITYVPRGSSDLVVPSTVLTTASFSFNTTVNQMISYAPSELAYVYAEFIITAVQAHTINMTSANYSFTLKQLVYRPAYLGYADLDLKQYR